MNERHRVVVVGGGIAGLTAATYVAKKGIDVLLLEKNQSTGGLINTFSRDGFVFDGGVRALESAGIIKPMIADLGIDLPSIKSAVSVGIANDVIPVKTEADLGAYRQLLLRFYPDSADDIDRLIAAIQNVLRNMKILYAVDNPLFKNFKEDRRYFLTTYLPWMFKFLMALRTIDKMKGPVEEFLAGRIHNQSLMDIVDQHFFSATPTFFAMSYFYLYTDYFYPKGGVGTLPRKVEEMVGSSGGAIIGWSFREPVPVTSSMLGVNASIKTTIPDVFKAGQWSYSPTGVPTSVMTGRLAADATIQALKR